MTAKESPAMTSMSDFEKASLELQRQQVEATNKNTAALRELQAEKKPRYDQIEELIADRKRLIAEQARVQTWVYRDSRENSSETRFEAYFQPSAQFPDGRMVLAAKLILAPPRTRAIYELGFGDSSKAIRDLAAYTHYGPLPGMTNSEIEKFDRESRLHGHEIGQLHTAAQNQIKNQTLQELIMPVRRLVGLTLAEARRFATFDKFEVLDEGLRSPFPLPEA